MTIRKRSKKWTVQVVINGNSVYKTFEDKNKAIIWEAEQKIILSTSDQILKNKTLSTAFDFYLIQVSEKKSSYRFDKVKFGKFKRQSFSDVAMYLLTVDDFNQYIQKELQRGLKTSTILRELGLLSSVFNFAIKQKFCRENIISKVDKPKSPKHRERRITNEETYLILEQLDYSDDKHITLSKQATALAFLFAIETGMRQGEIFNLLWDNVYIDKRYLTVIESKNGDSRDVPLSKRAIFLLNKILEDHNHYKVFNYNQASCGALFRKALKRAGIIDLHFHDARHEACSRLAKRFSMLELAKIIGHRDPRNLMIYYNPTAEELAEKLD